MKHLLSSARASFLGASFVVLLSALTYSTAAEEGTLGLPNDAPVDVCPQEIVRYEPIGAIDFSDPKTTLEGWMVKEGVVTLTRGEKTLRIDANDDDPFFFSPALSTLFTQDQLRRAVGKTLIKLTARRENTGLGQLFFATEAEPEFCEKNSFIFEMAKDSDWREYIVPLDISSVPIGLRFDVGGTKGFAEISKVEFYRVQYKPIDFGAFEIADGTLECTLTNNNVSPEIAELGYYGVDPLKQGRVARLEIPSETPSNAAVSLYFPSRRAFEQIELTVAPQSTKERFSRRFFAFNESAADRALESNKPVPTLKNEELEIRFAPDASGAEVFRKGRRVAVVSPLIVEEGDGAKIAPDRTDLTKVDLNARNEYDPQSANDFPGRLCPVFRGIEGDSAAFDLVRVPVKEAREALKAIAKESVKYDPWSVKGAESNEGENVDIGVKLSAAKVADDRSNVCGELKFRLNANTLEFEFDAPCDVHAPVFRVLGEMEQAILSGSEYLEKGERSSSSADIETKERFRYAQPVAWTTAPFASIVTDRCSASLLYDDPKARPIFAVPDFIDGDASSSRFNICARRGSGRIRIADGSEPIEEAILWSVKTRGLPELPTPKRVGKELAAYILAAFEESALKTEDGWSHAVMSIDPPELIWPSRGSDFASTIWEIKGEMPDVPDVSFGGGLIPNYTALLLKGQAQALAEHIAAETSDLKRELREDGSFRYSGKYLRGSRYDYASGYSGSKLAVLMEDWRVTKDDSILPVVKKGLDFANRLRTPAGAQTWELSIHTPDIMGASRCALANVMYYEATGEQEYLDAAVRWALTGIPFVYLWEDPELAKDGEPLMRYATIAVFGATNWASPNWMGRPVQWCGLDYARALTALAKYDDTLDWGKIAEGIVASAENQLGDGPYVGLLPDSFVTETQEKFGPYINPSMIWILRQTVDGKPTNSQVVDCAGHRILSPFPAQAEGKTVKIAGVKGMKYQVMIDGKEIREIESQGEDSIEF